MKYTTWHDSKLFLTIDDYDKSIYPFTTTGLSYSIFPTGFCTISFI